MSISWAAKAQATALGKRNLVPPRAQVTFNRPAGEVPAQDRLRAKDLAQLEGTSVRSAQRLMATGDLGPVHGPKRRRWVDRFFYNLWLDTT